MFHRIGAAISVESQIVPSVLSKLLFNPLCFLQYEHTIVAPGDWDDVSMTSSKCSLEKDALIIVNLASNNRHYSVVSTLEASNM